jgi:hypothetical protein
VKWLREKVRLKKPTADEEDLEDRCKQILPISLRAVVGKNSAVHLPMFIEKRLAVYAQASGSPECQQTQKIKINNFQNSQKIPFVIFGLEIKNYLSHMSRVCDSRGTQADSAVLD